MLYFPSHIQIETVNRYCNARCPMCSIKFVPDTKADEEDNESYSGIVRRPEIMTLETFKIIASKFVSHLENIKYLSLHGCGEPLLDKTLPEKVKFAKELGFREVGFTSNCHILKKKLAERLLKAGLNCIIPSIDGITKEVHEAIRPGTDYEQIIVNVKHFIAYRNKHDFNCKVLIRMIRQQLNYEQWEDYHEFWSGLLDPDKGDAILKIDVHNTGGKIKNFGKMKVNEYDEKISKFELDSHLSNTKMCPDLFCRLSIFASGDVALCSADQSSYYNLGNVLKEDPISIFNNKKFSEYREKWLKNKYMDLKYCRDCTIAISRHHKSYS